MSASFCCEEQPDADESSREGERKASELDLVLESLYDNFGTD